MIIVGLTGGIGQGKSTVGHLLRQQVPSSLDLEYSDLLLEVINRWLDSLPLESFSNGDALTRAKEWARYLPPVLENITGIPAPYALLEPDPTNPTHGPSHRRLIQYVDSLSEPVTITRHNKAEHRYVLQWLAAITRSQLHDSIWSRAMDRNLDRQLQTAAADLVTIGGIRHPSEVVPVHRHAGLVVRVVQPGAAWDDDVTEDQIAQLPHDIEISNDANLVTLERLVEQLWADITADAYRPGYVASQFA